MTDNLVSLSVPVKGYSNSIKGATYWITGGNTAQSLTVIGVVITYLISLTLSYVAKFNKREVRWGKPWGTIQLQIYKLYKY